MAEEVRLWQITDKDALGECVRKRLDLEVRLERWIAVDVSVLDPGLMVVGQQIGYHQKPSPSPVEDGDVSLFRGGSRAGQAPR